jgi:TPP-dependent pyruvate/acetoin dehydrogenase alpha subunit
VNIAPTEEDLDRPIEVTDERQQEAVDLYRRMTLIREFESRVSRLFLQGRIPGTIHLSLGQEACAVGGTASLRPSDWATLTHRGHGQALAKGVSPSALMAELFARETGCCRGMGGSLHVGDWSVGVLPAIGIVGASIPISAGLAFSIRQRNEDRVVVCFTGDGAITEGDSHEGFNLAALWQLPVVFVCENNLYSISTRVDRQARIIAVAERMAAYGLPALAVDGNNVLAVASAVAIAVDQARNGGGPFLIECLTYRQGGHKRDDPATYRPREEVDRWLARDPIARMRAGLQSVGLESEADAAELDATRQIDAAIAFAEASPPATGVLG